jgi:hypothetical protein
MAIADRQRNELEMDKFKESTTTTGQTGIVVVNPDGSNIGGGSSGGDGAIVDGVDPLIKATVVDLVNSGVCTEQARFYRPDHSFPTKWQHVVPSRLLYLKSRFRWALTKSGATLALFWMASVIHPLLAENLRKEIRKILLKRGAGIS